MTDRELLELIAAQVGALSTNIEDIRKDVKELIEGQSRIEDKLDDIEANNADRHITIDGEIRRIKSSLSKIEIVTANNWSDIARLKAYRKSKVRWK